MTTFDALLTSTSGATPVTAHFFGNQLLLHELGASVDVGRIVISVGGMEQPELFLNWLDAQGRQSSLQPSGQAALATVLQEAPASLQPSLNKLWRERRHNRRQVSGWLAGLSGAAVLAGGLLWWQGNHAIGALAGMIPLSTEQQLGELALAQVRAQGKLAASGAAQQTVREIGQRLTAGSRYQYRWFVRQDDSVNAFAMPGGIIVVHTGLLRQAGNPEELAGVLAHEVQHVEQRHSLRQMLASLGWGALVAATVGDISAVAAMLAHQAGAMYFSRDMEEEADRLGVQALQRARIRPDGMLTFFRKLGQEDRHKAQAPGWIASHPQTAARVQRVTALIDATPCPDCRPVGSRHWLTMKAELPPGDKR